jgi:predicted outer membrane repeat protein
MYYRTAWGDYFTGSPSSTLSGDQGARQTPSVANVYVSNCLFRSITSTSSGGALYCSSSVSILLVESSSFFSCKSSSNGGAIYFYNYNSGQSVYHKVCGFDCFSTYTNGNVNSYMCGQFSYNVVQDVASSKNYVNYSSIVRCAAESLNTRYFNCHHYGKHCYPSVNLSMNKCYLYSGIYCCPFSDSNSVTCSLSYTTHADNIATGYTCIYFCTGGAKYEIKSCNILRNTQNSLDSYGTIYTTGNLMIENSCILENTANRIFHSSSSSYPITLSNCTVDKTTNNGYLTIQNTVTKSFILALNHMSTRNCASEYDSAGTLIPIIQSPTPSKRQMQCYTGRIIVLQLPQGNLFSLISLFIFNFIHPYASTYLLY